MAKPIVSILIPVYNVENYLEKCLDSVISQTMNNIEIICVNDGSTDHSGEILEKYQKKDKRIIVVNKENGGLPSARNAGLEIARGKYIGFVDSDDYINSDMYEKMYRAAKKHDSDVVICGANIYPEEPHADQWLYNCLSPKSRYYDKFEPDILFQEQDMSPFLWRTMVSRRLIEKKNFRLDEEVQIGEDKAFQNKIYPYAKSITVISDKLYNYCWYRPGSLMERNVYTDPTLKVEKHIKLIETMSEDINKLPLSTDLRQMKESFLKWAISFIYNDFVYCTQKQKKNCANRLIQVLKNNNVNAFLYYWDDNLKSQYVYIKGEQEIDTSTEVKLSLIIPCEYESTYFGKCLDYIKKSQQKDVEYILVNNGLSMPNYIKSLKVMKDKSNLRLFNTPKHYSFDQICNTGISLAEGTYVGFWNPDDFYKSENELENWLNKALDESVDICVSKNLNLKWQDVVFADCKQLSTAVKTLWTSDLYHTLYRRKFLTDENIQVNNYSKISGFEFYCKSVLKAERIGFYQESVYYVRDIWTKDWMETQKVELLLQGIDAIMDLSIEYDNAYLHSKIVNMLNGDELKKIIVRNTLPWKGKESEGSQVESCCLIFKISQKIDTHLLDEAGILIDGNTFGLLYDMVSERQKFIAKIG